MVIYGRLFDHFLVSLTGTVLTLFTPELIIRSLHEVGNGGGREEKGGRGGTRRIYFLN